VKERLSDNEKETIINFNEGEPLASIFTYNRAWQKHMEKSLGLKPLSDNGYGGREYEISKKRIKPPRAPKKLSAEAREKLVKRLQAARKNQDFRASNNAVSINHNTKKKKLTNTINKQLTL